MKSRFQTARGWLLFWTLFIGIGAAAGATGMFADPTGKAMKMDAMLPYFQKLPLATLLFQDYLFSGFALLIVNGLTNLTAAILLLCRKKTGVILGELFGVTLMLWIGIQFYMFPLNFMSTIYFVFGFCQAVTGYAARIFERQECFTVDEKDYPQIGTNPKRMVVYFSRMGYVKKVALTEANRTGAVLFELKSTERTAGTTGFWWCGRYGMHRWEMPLEAMPEDLSQFEQVTICSPIWVFTLASPIRAFCHMASGSIQAADLITVHHTRGRYLNTLREAEKLLGISLTDYQSIICRCGVMYPMQKNTEKSERIEK